jgi:membrane-associated protein
VPHTTNLALLPDWLDAEKILQAFGPYAFLIVLVIVFAECGLLIGFFMPGDSLLFTTGLFISQGWIDVPLWLACVLLTIVACLGNLVGYWIGYRSGPAIFNKPNSKLFKREYVDKTHEFFEKYGAGAIVLARFVPIVRTFITVIAGVGRMDFRRYALYTTIGGVLWGAGVTIAGYYLGQIAFIRNNLEAMAIAIVLVSVLPIAFEAVRGWLRQRRRANAAARATAAGTAGSAEAGPAEGTAAGTAPAHRAEAEGPADQTDPADQAGHHRTVR